MNLCCFNINGNLLGDVFGGNPGGLIKPYPLFVVGDSLLLLVEGYPGCSLTIVVAD